MAEKAFVPFFPFFPSLFPRSASLELASLSVHRQPVVPDETMMSCMKRGNNVALEPRTTSMSQALPRDRFLILYLIDHVCCQRNQKTKRVCISIPSVILFPSCCLQLDEVAIFKHSMRGIFMQVVFVADRPVHLVLGIPQRHGGWCRRGGIFWHGRRRRHNLCVENSVYNASGRCRSDEMCQ